MLLSSLLSQGHFNSGLIINAERYTLRVNFKDRRNAILFGDGVTSCFLSTEEEEGFEILDLYLESDPSGAQTVQTPINRFFEQDTAVKKLIESYRKNND